MATGVETSARSSKFFQQRWGIGGLIVLAWLLIGFATALNNHFFADKYVRLFESPVSLWTGLIWELSYWLIWLALAPLLLWLVRRFSFEREQWWRSLTMHVLAILLLPILQRAVFLLVGFLIHDASHQPLSLLLPLYRHLLLFNLPTGMLSCGTILMICHVTEYYRRLREEELRAAQLKARLAEVQLQITQAQLQALKMQLQPHFLFNTLNSITALLDEDVATAEDMITRLGHFLRLTLDHTGAQEVSLRQELEFLQCYLEIERVRFQDRLTVRLEIEPETLSALVPNLILQPLAENAIRHAVVPRLTPTEIVMRARRKNDMLELQVQDNGPGLPRAGAQKEGLGLANTRARLQQLYGAAQRLVLREAATGGLLVSLEIPWRADTVTSDALSATN